MVYQTIQLGITNDKGDLNGGITALQLFQSAGVELQWTECPPEKCSKVAGFSDEFLKSRLAALRNRSCVPIHSPVGVSIFQRKEPAMSEKITRSLGFFDISIAQVISDVYQSQLQNFHLVQKVM